MKKSLITLLFALFSLTALDAQAGGGRGMGGGGNRGMGMGGSPGMGMQQRDHFRDRDQQRLRQHQNTPGQYQDGAMQQRREMMREQNRIQQNAPASAGKAFE